ncbi:MAG: recombinase family protein [Actinomycetota bacterium]|nr:recombinase family protein [Actinomycetota bacterium]
MLHNPRYAGAFTYGRHREQLRPGRKRGSSITVPRQEWISFIPGSHPGYITVDQWEANTARLAANAAAHGRDRAAGPPREGPALLQGIIICGRCGGRMTIRYHARGGKDLPAYLCQRDGIGNARPICAAFPGHTLDERVGQLLIDTLTPLAVEAALQVSAELRQRAAEADALRAAHVERARYHAGLARRRYLAVDPASRLVADTLEADWNTALRALNDAQTAYDKACEQHAGTLTPAQKNRISQLVTDLPGIWNDPATPMRERKRIARLLLTDVTATRTRDTITAHIRLPAGQTCTLTLPIPPTAAQLRKTPAAAVTAIDELLDHHTHAQIAGILNQRSLTSGEGRPFTPAMVLRVIRTYQLRSREQRLRDAGMLTLPELAAQLGVSTGTVKIWHHAGLLTGHPSNDKGQCLYPPPGPNPPARAQGRKLSQRRLTTPLTPDTAGKMSDPTTTI